MIRGYHAWTKREVSKRAQEDQALAEQREQIFQANRGVYGSPRIHAELQEQGRRYGRKRIARLMQERGISAQRKRRRVRTTDSHHSHPVAPESLNREFTASAPNTKWVTDITAIETAEGDLSSFWSCRYLLSHGGRLGYGQQARTRNWSPMRS